ncbi:MAG: DUF433 domain-containing protein [Vulcanimicrobiota bacterium]
MRKKNLMSRITFNPDIMVGKPTIRNMRITVEQVINSLAAGIPEDELLEEHPELEKDDIRAALKYAAGVISKEEVFKL